MKYRQAGKEGEHKGTKKNAWKGGRMEGKEASK
jgi:hypothetical protein